MKLYVKILNIFTTELFNIIVGPIIEKNTRLIHNLFKNFL